MKTYYVKYDAIAEVRVPVEALDPEDAVQKFLRGKAGSYREVQLENMVPNPFSVYDSNNRFLRCVDITCEEQRIQEAAARLFKEETPPIICLSKPQFIDEGYLNEITSQAVCRVKDQAEGLCVINEYKWRPWWKKAISRIRIFLARLEH